MTKAMLIERVPHWTHFEPQRHKVCEVLRQAGVPEPELARVPKEIARMQGDSDYHIRIVLQYMDALGGGSWTAEEKILLLNTRWRNALRVFQMLPHPEMPKSLRNSEAFESRAMYLQVGAILACGVRGLDLKVLGRYYTITANKAFHAYADASLARLDMIEQLRNLGELPLTCSTAGYWLFIEFEMASRRWRNRGIEMSKSEAYERRKANLNYLRDSVLDLAPISAEKYQQHSLWATVQAIAANTAMKDPRFRGSYFKPWETRERRWNKERTRHLETATKAPRRGPKLGSKRKKAVENSS